MLRMQWGSALQINVCGPLVPIACQRHKQNTNTQHHAQQYLTYKLVTQGGAVATLGWDLLPGADA